MISNLHRQNMKKLQTSIKGFQVIKSHKFFRLSLWDTPFAKGEKGGLIWEMLIIGLI